MIPYGRQSVTLLDALRVAFQVRFRTLTQGPKIAEFEKAVADYVGSKYAVAVSSATAGLHLTNLALSAGRRGKVITSPISFAASSNSVIYAGLSPVFVDINPRTLNIDSEGISQVIEADNEILGVTVVHFAGAACDMGAISELTKRKGLFLIEDAAHGLGGQYMTGENIGCCKYSDATVFSFHPVKSVTTGEGGVITTNSKELYELLISLRSHGFGREGAPVKEEILGFTNEKKNIWYQEMDKLGFHYRLTEIQAVLGISQMKRLTRFIHRRRKLVFSYLSLLHNNSIIRPSQEVDFSTSANHLFVVTIDFSKLNLSRNDLMLALKSRGIGTQVHYKPIFLHPYYESYDYDQADFPNALSYYSQCISLPLFPSLTMRKQRRVVRELELVIQKARI